MGLKIISGFIMPTNLHFRNGAATLNLESGQFVSSSQFSVSDHRVSGSGPFVRRPHVVIALRRIRMFVGDIGSGENDIGMDLGDDFQQVVGGVPRRLKINWELKHRISDLDGSVRVMQNINEDRVAEISYLVIGETKDPKPTIVKPRRPVAVRRGRAKR